MHSKNELETAKTYIWASHPYFAFADMMTSVVEVAWILGTIGSFIYGLENAWWMVLWTVGVLIFNALFSDRVEMRWIEGWMAKELPDTPKPTNDPNYA